MFPSTHSKASHVSNLSCPWNKGVFGSGLWIALGFGADRSDLDSEVVADGRKWERLNARADVLMNWGLQEGHSS